MENELAIASSFFTNTTDFLETFFNFYFILAFKFIGASQVVQW